MKAVEVDMEVHSAVTIEDRLRELCANSAEKLTRKRTDAPGRLSNLLLDTTIGFCS